MAALVIFTKVVFLSPLLMLVASNNAKKKNGQRNFVFLVVIVFLFLFD